MVAIKNFDMPNSCRACQFYEYDDGTNYCGLECINLEFVNKGERHENCPLVDIDIDGRWNDKTESTTTISQVIGYLNNKDAHLGIY